MVVAVAVADLDRHAAVEAVGYGLGAFARSEERRVGKECRL